MQKPSPANSEWLTRKQLIDKQLGAAGWRVTLYRDGIALSRFNRCAVEEYPTASGPTDYALILDGCVVGVVEARKLSLGPQNVLSQAERYSRGVAQRFLADAAVMKIISEVEEDNGQE